MYKLKMTLKRETFSSHREAMNMAVGFIYNNTDS